MLTSASKLIVAKGKKVTEFSKDQLNDESAVAAMLGPTGNLRAPTIITGTTVLVGFNEARFDAIFNK